MGLLGSVRRRNLGRLWRIQRIKYRQTREQPKNDDPGHGDAAKQALAKRVVIRGFRFLIL